jgi:DNA-binding GntR family transcriptional regulator
LNVAVRKTKSRQDDSSVGRVYEKLKSKAISFEFRPGDRLNEVAIARQFGVSRTPLREALNRLTADGFLTFSPKQGFFRKPLEVKEIFDLYELRLLIETGAARLAAERGSDEAISEIEDYLDHGADEFPERTIDNLVALDEGFHERLMKLSGNVEMLRTLQNINARIRYVRWIDMQGRRDGTQGEHRAIVQALKRRDPQQCAALLRQHIERRLDQITEAVRNSYARIYVVGESSQPVL